LRSLLPRLWILGRAPRSPERFTSSAPDWAQCQPGWIERSLRRALALPSGGWYVIDAARAIGRGPRCYRIRGRAWVVWRAGGEFRVAPNACPHMGASLAEGRVVAGQIVCPWHGLALGDAPHGAFRALPAHDDGVLVWARLDEGEAPTAAPIVPARPSRYLDAVIRREARCVPEDVIANRLDPWHGAHLHAHSFGRLRVIAKDEDAITVRVVYRVLGKVGVEVDARFHCPEPRTIVMTIVSGEGEGSVVETHATPIDHDRTAIVEATLATSERIGFRAAALCARLIRPLVRRAAGRLWVEDAAYAERLYALRRGEA
jgi:isorenieratene synthase